MHAYSHDSSRFIHFCIPQLAANLSSLMLRLSRLELLLYLLPICTHDSPLQMRYSMHSAVKHVTHPQFGGGVRALQKQGAESWSAKRQATKAAGGCSRSNTGQCVLQQLRSFTRRSLGLVGWFSAGEGGTGPAASNCSAPAAAAAKLAQLAHPAVRLTLLSSGSCSCRLPADGCRLVGWVGACCTNPAGAAFSAQLSRPVVRLKLLAELVGPLLLDCGALLPRPPVHILLGQAQQACKGMGGMAWHGMAWNTTCSMGHDNQWTNNHTHTSWQQPDGRLQTLLQTTNSSCATS